MASTSVITIANTTSTKNLNATGKTDTQVGEILEWAIVDWASPMPEGLTLAQQRQWKLDQLHQMTIDFWKAKARTNRLNALRAQQQSLESQADTDTNI